MACNSCKSENGVDKVKWTVLLLGVYVLGAAIYGTVEIVKNILTLIK